MTKLEAYESALTLYGQIFSQLNSKAHKYFFATIKRDFVFFLFALIWKGQNKKNEAKYKSRLIPRNFNEWHFGGKSISLTDTILMQDDSRLWNIDRDYFRKNTFPKKNSKEIAVLGSGIDLEKTFDLPTIIREREVKMIAKKSLMHDAESIPLFLENISALFEIYRILNKACLINCSLIAFLRYFAYYAFASARLRVIVRKVASNPAIGKIMASDLDNVIGNSMILWSHFYSLEHIAYPHGSPLVASKNRYFDPEEYYIWTTYQKKHVQNFCSKMPKIIYQAPTWTHAEIKPKPRFNIKNIVIVTAMEENLEVPFADRTLLLNYIETICQFALKKNLAVYLKSHKLLDWHDDYDRLCQKYGNLTHVKKRWHNEQLQEMDIGILMNTSTTMSLQMMQIGIPAISCSEMMPEIVSKHFQAPIFSPQASNITELLDILENLCSQEKFYQKTSTRAQETFSQIISI